MPGSLPNFDDTLVRHLRDLNPRSFLDVGCGDGNYAPLVRDTLPSIEHLHAIEPSPEYTQCRDGRYDKVYDCTIQDFLKQDISVIYDVAYCSDMLEHLFLSEAIDTIDSLLYCCRWVIAKWPTNVSQGWYEGNYYEKHKSNIELTDLQRFNIHYYAKISPDQGMEYHYCVISGFHAGNNHLLGS